MDEPHASQPQPKIGRPSLFTPELAAKLCERLADGESLRRICRDDDMPSRATVLRWLDANGDDFRGQYARARDLQADSLAEETLEIADYGANDTYLDNDGNKRTDFDVIARSKLRVEARKWYAAKLAPKKYGDKLELNATHHHDISNLSDDELGRALLDRGAATGSAEAAGAS